jgi:hypothetical protein
MPKQRCQRGGVIEKGDILSRIISIDFELKSYNIRPVHINYGSPHVVRLTGHDHKITDDQISIQRSVNRSMPMANQDDVFDVLKKAVFHNDVTLVVRDEQKDLVTPFGPSENPESFINLDPRSFVDGDPHIYHTEFKITYDAPEQHDNILLTYLLKSLDLINNYIIRDNTLIIDQIDIWVNHGIGDRDSIIYQNPLYSDYPCDTYLFHYDAHDDDDFLVVLPINNDDELYPINSISWHAQCTISIHITDLIDVLGYIIRGDDVSQCWQDTYEESIVGMGGLTPIESNLLFLQAMFLCQEMRKSLPTAIRQTYNEVIEYHLNRHDIREHVYYVLHAARDLVFNVTHQVGKYNGILEIELRDFNHQLIHLMMNYTDYVDDSFIYTGIQMGKLQRFLNYYLFEQQQEADAAAAVDSLASALDAFNIERSATDDLQLQLDRLQLQ